MSLFRAPERESLIDAILRAQGGHCPGCGDRMYPVTRRHCTRGWTFEHVWPLRYRYHHRGNLLVSHSLCNNRKADRDPTGCEVLLLAAVNAQLGFELRPRQLHFTDPTTAPSALALALARAGVA